MTPILMVRPAPLRAPGVTPAPSLVSSLAEPAKPVQVSAPAPKAKVPLSDQEIFSEIEALRELGAWSEEDEEAIGIPAESIFSELELTDQDFKSQSSAGNDIMQAKGEMYGNG